MLSKNIWCYEFSPLKLFVLQKKKQTNDNQQENQIIATSFLYLCVHAYKANYIPPGTTIGSECSD